MVTLNASMSQPDARERVLVVGDGAEGRAVWSMLRTRYVDWQTAPCASYLAAIAELTKRPARAVLACVSAAQPHLADAVAGLRMAAGNGTRILLCCTTATEPLARTVRGASANDYLVLPLELEELDRALGRVTVEVRTRRGDEDAADLKALSETLAAYHAPSGGGLPLLAELVRGRLSAKGVTLVVEGTMVSSGDSFTKPVLTTPLTREGRVVGQILVGARSDGPFEPVDAERLRYLGFIMGHLLAADARQRQWQRLALTDEVSGLPNRRFLSAQLPIVLARAQEERFPVTLLLFDVDDFKRYNDAHGHDAGDEIIRAVSRLFRQHCREQDIVVRYGGDEFAVAFWDPEGSRVAGSSHPESALRVLDRFTSALREHAIPCVGEARVTISGGLATYPWNGDTMESLIAKADEALLAAKRAGKNRVLVMGAQDKRTQPSPPHHLPIDRPVL